MSAALVFLSEIKSRLQTSVGCIDHLNIEWLNPDTLNCQWRAGENFDPDCHILVEGPNEYAFQRDFCAVRSGNHVVVVADSKEIDGPYNFLRWLVPRELILQGKFVFHSSCIVDDNDQAYLCLGPSGAGKTTISELALSTSLTRFRVLGDDMNVVELSQNQLIVSATDLGQRIEDPSLRGQKFFVKKLFWLVKSNELRLVPLNRASSYSKVAASLANMFWNHLDESRVVKLQAAIVEIVKRQPLAELHFPKQANIWSEIRGFP